MTDLHVHIPDEVAQRLATEAAQRGTSTEDVAAELLSRYAPAPQGRSFDFIGMFDAPVGFDAQRDEELLETEGFIALAHAKPGFSARAAEELLEVEGFAAPSVSVPQATVENRVPRFVGLGHSGRSDLSERAEEILRADFGA